MLTQPLLFVPPDIEAGLLDGSLKLFGSVVRDSDTGHIVKHLKNVEQVENAVRKSNPKVVVPVVACVVMLAGAATFMMRRRGKAKEPARATRPECAVDFETFLRAYLEAGRAGALTTAIVDRLIVDLDAVRTFSEDGNDVKIPLDELVPLFDVVIAHTSTLADALHFELADLRDDELDDDTSVVISLRRNLEAQKAILEEAA